MQKECQILIVEDTGRARAFGLCHLWRGLIFVKMSLNHENEKVLSLTTGQIKRALSLGIPNFLGYVTDIASVIVNNRFVNNMGYRF